MSLVERWICWKMMKVMFYLRMPFHSCRFWNVLLLLKMITATACGQNNAWFCHCLPKKCFQSRSFTYSRWKSKERGEDYWALIASFFFSSYVIRLKPHLERSSAFIVIYLSVFASIYLVVELLSIGFFFFLWKPTEICDHIAVSRESINEIYLQPSSGKHFEVLCLSREA